MIASAKKKESSSGAVLLGHVLAPRDWIHRERITPEAYRYDLDWILRLWWRVIHCDGESGGEGASTSESEQAGARARGGGREGSERGSTLKGLSIGSGSPRKKGPLSA